MIAEAIIPARGGSKRIPGKNTREFCGKPIIAYSIEACLEAGIFSRVSVSTDSEEIAGVAKSFGAEVPHLRPARLSEDDTTLLDVMSYEAEIRAESEAAPDLICFVLPTAPFIRPEVLKQGKELMESGEWDYILGAATFPSPVRRSFVVKPSGGTEMLFPEAYREFSNQYPEVFYDAGQFYWGSVADWVNPNAGFFGEKTTIIQLPRYEVQDIDTKEDWDVAERLYRLRESA